MSFLEELAVALADPMVAAAWDEAKHPRHPAGDENGGEFAALDAIMDLLPESTVEVRPEPEPRTQEWYEAKFDEHNRKSYRMQFAEEVPVEEIAKYMEYDRRNGPPGEATYDPDEPYYAAMREHIRVNGINEPVFLDYNAETEMGHVSEGHHRIEIARDLGMETVPVVVYPSRRAGSKSRKLGAYTGPPVDERDPGRLPEYGKPSYFGLPTIGPSVTAAVLERAPALGTFNRRVKEAAGAALLNQEALEAVYASILRAGLLEASERFAAQTQEYVTAAAWVPPDPQEVMSAEELAAAVAQQTTKARKKILKAMLVSLDLEWEITNPFATQLLDALGRFAARLLIPGLRQAVQQAITEGYEQGLSVPNTAQLIRNAGVGARAEMMARTDLTGLTNGASVAAASLVYPDGTVLKRWLSGHDDRVRPDHVEADGQTVPIDQPFQVGPDLLMFPGDPSGSDAETCNCRCTTIYIPIEEALAAAGWDPADHPREPKGKGGGRFRSIAEVEAANPDVDLFAHESSVGITLTNISVSSERQGEGLASKALDDLLEYADSTGQTTALTVGDVEGRKGLSKAAKTEWYKRRGFKPNRGRNKDFGFTETMVRPAEMTAAGWDESKYVRHPAGERDGVRSPTDGGKFAPKEGGRALPKPPKLIAAEALREELENLWYGSPEREALLAKWGEWTPEEMELMRSHLQRELAEGHRSGLLSVQYAKEIQRSLSKPRNEARKLLEQLDKTLMIHHVERFGLDPEDYPELFPPPEEARPKAPDPRSQGIPEIYLSESGKFKPGYDAKLKSDLVSSALDYHPTAEVLVKGVPSEDLRHRVAEHWRNLNPEEAVRQQWTDEQIWPIAHGDPQMDDDLYMEVQRTATSRRERQSTLLHRFSHDDARRILEERGWDKYLDDKQMKLKVGGRILSRSPEEVALLEDADRNWGDALTVRGVEYSKPTVYKTTAGMFGPNVVRKLKDGGITVHMGTGASTDQDELQHYNEQGRMATKGWGNNKMDKAGGFYTPSERKVTAGTAGEDGSANVAAHEIGHAIGHVLKVDSNEELAGWHERLYPKLSPYMQQGRKRSEQGVKELWAEGTAVAVERGRRKVLDLPPSTNSGVAKYQHSNDPDVEEYYAWVQQMLANLEST